LPYPFYSEPVQEVIKCLGVLGVMVPFDWAHWGDPPRYRDHSDELGSPGWRCRFACSSPSSDPSDSLTAASKARPRDRVDRSCPRPPDSLDQEEGLGGIEIQSGGSAVFSQRAPMTHRPRFGEGCRRARQGG
jgi:hypothetical protein